MTSLQLLAASPIQLPCAEEHYMLHPSRNAISGVGSIDGLIDDKISIRLYAEDSRSPRTKSKLGASLCP